jgi:hypothetical protein
MINLKNSPKVFGRRQKQRKEKKKTTTKMPRPLPSSQCRVTHYAKRQRDGKRQAIANSQSEGCVDRKVAGHVKRLTLQSLATSDLPDSDVD